MVVSLTFKSNAASAQKRMANLAMSQVPFAVAKSLTMTSKTLQEQNQRDMSGIFSNPTAWTKGAFRIIPAKKNNPRTFILRKDQAPASASNTAPSKQHYLSVQQRGGPRPPKAFETAIRSRGKGAQNFSYATPTSQMRVNKSGNITKNAIGKIITDIGQKGGKHFVPQSTHPLAIRFGDGVFERMANNKVRKRLHLHTKMPTYRPRFKFYQRMERYGRRAFPRIFQQEFRAAIRSAKGMT